MEIKNVMNKKRFVSASAGGLVRPQSGWGASSLQDEVLPAGGVGVGSGRKLGCEAEQLAMAVEGMPVWALLT